MSDQTQTQAATAEQPWGQPIPGEAAAAWRDREREQRRTKEGAGRMDSRTYLGSDAAEASAAAEESKARQARARAAETPKQREYRVAGEKLQAELDARNEAYRAQEAARADAQARADADELQAARAAWAAKQKAEDDAKVREWYRGQQKAPGRL